MGASNILSLPSEVLGLVISNLDHDERYRLIPLVNRQFRQIHKDNPPRESQMYTDASEQPSATSYLKYFASLVPSLEKWTIECSHLRTVSLLPHLMARTAMLAPRLRTLRIFVEYEDLDFEEYKGFAFLRPALSGVVLFTQLRKLAIDPWIFPGAGDAGPVQGLSGLQKLETLEVYFLGTTDVTAAQADSFWAALATIRSLHTVKSGLSFHCQSQGLRGPFLKSLPLMTQISRLALKDPRFCLDEDDMLPEGFSTMTRLTHLAVADAHNFTTAELLPSAALHVISGLPKLQSLVIGINEEFFPFYQDTEGIDLQSTALTFLAVPLGLHSTSQLGLLLPPTAPALQYLKELELPESRLDDFPAGLAKSLKALTKLDLNNNNLPALPSSLSHLTALCELDVSCNEPLQLQHSDLGTLNALANLQKLKMQKRYLSPTSFTMESMWIFLSIGRRFPCLELPGP